MKFKRGLNFLISENFIKNPQKILSEDFSFLNNIYRTVAESIFIFAVSVGAAGIVVSAVEGVIMDDELSTAVESVSVLLVEFSLVPQDVITKPNIAAKIAFS